jgi:uncharacterized membrane protein
MSDFFAPEKLHAMAVHFPIVLLIISLLITLISAWKKDEMGDRFSFLLLLTSAATLIIAYWTGDSASDWFNDSPLKPLIHAHENSAYICIGLTIMATVTQALSRFLKQKKLFFFGILFHLAAVFFVLRTAHLGGNLVYRNGAGVHLSKETNGIFAPVK